jgi:hypothetical protein
VKTVKNDIKDEMESLKLAMRAEITGLKGDIISEMQALIRKN